MSKGEESSLEWLEGPLQLLWLPGEEIGGGRTDSTINQHFCRTSWIYERGSPSTGRSSKLVDPRHLKVEWSPILLLTLFVSRYPLLIDHGTGGRQLMTHQGNAKGGYKDTIYLFIYISYTDVAK